MVRFGRMTAVLLMVAAVLVGSPTALFAQAKIRVAVMNFENNSTWAWWGDNLGAAAADELATQLVQTGKYTVIERRELASILQEQNLGASGAVTGGHRRQGRQAARRAAHAHWLDHRLLDQAHVDRSARHRRQLLERREQGGRAPGQHRNRRSDARGRGPGQQAHGRRLLQGRQRRADLRPGRGPGSPASGRRAGGGEARPSRPVRCSR